MIEYLDGRATPATRRVVEQHLAGCAACRVRAEEFRAVWAALDDLPVISPSRAFDTTLGARLAAEPARRQFWAWLPSPKLGFAVAALVLFSAWISSLPQSPPREPAQIQPAVVESDFGMIQDLPVLENYDVVSNFEALSELPSPSPSGDEVQESR